MSAQPSPPRDPAHHVAFFLPDHGDSVHLRSNSPPPATASPPPALPAKRSTAARRGASLSPEELSPTGAGRAQDGLRLTGAGRAPDPTAAAAGRRPSTRALASPHTASPTRPPPPRTAPYHHHGPPSVSAAPAALHPVQASSSTSMGIQVVIKPEYRITPPPQLPPQLTEVTRSTFNFDFEYERKILAESEKQNPNWSKFVVESQPPPPPPQLPRGPKLTSPTTSVATPGDPVVDKYITMGLGREAVSFAVLNYGDNPVKVREFVKSYNALHEMGFTSSNVPELLAIHDNDPDKVIQHLIGTS